MIQKRRNRKKRYGFTMIEIMAVLIILGLLATLVGTKVVNHIEDAKEVTTKTNLKTYHTAVISFQMKHGRLPSEEEGLDALIHAPSDVDNYPNGGYLDSTDIEKDGWKHDFIYELVPGDSAGSGFLVRSCGPDGEQDTDDDIVSTDLN